jgi:hypothetical protein
VSLSGSKASPGGFAFQGSRFKVRGSRFKRFEVRGGPLPPFISSGKEGGNYSGKNSVLDRSKRLLR